MPVSNWVYVQTLIAVALTFAFWGWVIRGLVRRHRNYLKKHPELVPTPEEKAARKEEQKRKMKRQSALLELDNIMLDAIEHREFSDISTLNSILKELYPDKIVSATSYSRCEVEIAISTPGIREPARYMLSIVSDGIGSSVAINYNAINTPDDFVYYIDEDLK